MVVSAMTRRAALAALGAFGLSLTCAASSARAQSGLRFSNIVVNVEPLRAQFGDPTAAWMEQALVQALPQVLGPHLAPGVRNAAILEVRIDWIYLAPSQGGPGPGGSTQDTIIGSFVVPAPGRNQFANSVAGDQLLLPDGCRPGARRASLSRAHCRSRSDLRGLGAKGTRALEGRHRVFAGRYASFRGLGKKSLGDCAPSGAGTGIGGNSVDQDTEAP